MHHEDDGHHVIADGPDPSQKMHHDEGHDHHDKKNAMPGRSSDVSVKMIVFFLITIFISISFFSPMLRNFYN